MKMNGAGGLFLLSLLIFISGINCKYKKADENCGVAFTPTTIEQMWYGGDLTPYEHPWLCNFSFVSDGIETYCSAILISQRSIVADPSCFSELNHTKIKNLKCGAVKYRVPLKALGITIISGPGNQDLARIGIKKVTFSSVIRPICLFKYEEISEGDPVVVLGSSEISSDKPQKAVITTRSCGIINENITTKGIICGSSIFTLITQNDRGAPLLTSFNGRYYLIGILSGKMDVSDVILQNLYPLQFIRVSPFCKTILNAYTDIPCFDNAVPITSDSFSCGTVYKRNKRAISLGKDIDNLQPWYCRLMKDDYDSCGAVLISFKHVLIAAHCIDDDIDVSGMKVKCGINFQITSNVAKKFIPEEFIHETLENDIAILKFDKEIDFDGNVVPACLTTDDDLEGYELIAVGRDGDSSMTSKSVKLLLANQSECEETFKNYNFTLLPNSPTSFCLKSNHSLTQKGDSGGPLLVYKNNKWHIVGIVSGGITDQETNYFHFTRVAQFYDFINIHTDSHIRWSSIEENLNLTLYITTVLVPFLVLVFLSLMYRFDLHFRIYEFFQRCYFYLWKNDSMNQSLKIEYDLDSSIT